MNKFLNSRLVFLFISMLLVGCNEKFTLQVQLSQVVANNIILELGKNDIPATKVQQKDGTYTVLINEKDEVNSLEILQHVGLPNQQFTSLGEVFKKDSFISSPIEEHGRLVFALNQEVSSMLSQIDGVTSVSTEINLAQGGDNLWQTADNHSSAAVVIKYRYGYRLDLYLAKIKNLVAKSVPDLTPDNVEVLLVPVSQVTN